MCIGVPMQVVESRDLIAICRNDEEQRQEKVDMSLVGAQPEGTWVLVFMGAAREVIAPETLDQVLQARKAMAAALSGEPVDQFFADLVNREPELPDFLK